MSDWILLSGSRKVLATILVCVGTAAVDGNPAAAQEKPTGQAPGKFERQIEVPALQFARPVCTVLDAAAAAYSAHGSQGMTLWADDRPVPFTLTINSPQETAPTAAAIVNFRTSAGTTDFDLQMPLREYSAVTLKLAGKSISFAATVTSGLDGKQLGRFSLFDLTAEGGAANTTMRLGALQDRTLQVHLDRELARGQLLAAVVPPSRQDETLFTTVAAALPQRIGTRDVAEFEVPRGVPIERTRVDVSGSEGFRAAVTVQSGSDSVQGVIQRADLVRNGLALKTDDASIDSVLPDNEYAPMRVMVTIAVQNAGARPLPIRLIELQMRQRQICFTAVPGVQHWRLFYGSPTLQFVALGGRSRSLVQKMDPLLVPLGPETQAANFQPLAEKTDKAPRRLLVITLCYLTLLGAWLARVLRRARIPHVRR